MFSGSGAIRAADSRAAGQLARKIESNGAGKQDGQDQPRFYRAAAGSFARADQRRSNRHGPN